jgi:hypothetical protein
VSMSSNLEQYKTDLTKLLAASDAMFEDLHLRSRADGGSLGREERARQKQIEGTFESRYQNWYTESQVLLRQLLPDRLMEFRNLYEADPKRKSIGMLSFSIQDWFKGMRIGVDDRTGRKSFDDVAAVAMRFNMQREILKSVASRFESSLFDIRQLVQADLFDSELEVAAELRARGFLRGAGAVAGVVLERHLRQVCANHQVVLRKKNSTIADLNDTLREAGVFDVPAWRGVQRLGDIRNLCDHAKEREPTADEVQQLIDGASRIVKTTF